MVRYGRGVERYIALMNDGVRDWMTEAWAFYGPTGTGKSRRALWLSKREAAKFGQEPYWLVKPGGGGTVWWDGYDGHAIVVIDEFYGWIPYDTLLRLLDRYPMRGEGKGTTVNLVPRMVIITSNSAPEAWYPNVPDTSALMRRLNAGHMVFMPGDAGVWEPPADDASSRVEVVQDAAALECSETELVPELVPVPPELSPVSSMVAPGAPKKRKRVALPSPSGSDDEGSDMDIQIVATQDSTGVFLSSYMDA